MQSTPLDCTVITAPLETFAPAPLLVLINDASYWVGISLAVLLAISCVLVVVAVLRPSARKRWLLAAGAVAFCGFISDEFVYRYYWDGVCAHAGYYQDRVRRYEIPSVPSTSLDVPVLSGLAWETSLMAVSYTHLTLPTNREV